MLAALMMSLALSGQEPCADLWSDKCEAERRARPNCFDDNLTDRCAADEQARVRTLLGVASIEDESAAGVEAYRAFFVDGYGNDMPAVAFERRPGEGPKVVVYGREGRSMSAPVSADIWQNVQSESRFADRVLQEPVATATAEGQPTALPAMCLHSWVQTVEMANTWPERWSVTPVRRRTEDACGGGLTTRFAFHLADVAVKAIPPCDVLDEGQQRNRITQLDTCLRLKGDRLAAADLRNARSSFGLRRGADPADAYAWQAAMGTNGSPRLVWAGQEIKTERSRDKNVAEFLIARHAELSSLTFRQTVFEGIDSRRAIAEGVASYVVDETTWQADYRQTWVWDPSLIEWMLSDWVVESFAPGPAR